MNGIVAPIVAVDAPLPTDFLRPRPSVSVVMVVYMTGEALEQSVACVLSDPLVDEFVIVNNGSPAADVPFADVSCSVSCRLKRLWEISH